jgi:chromosome segregation ATPase
MTHLRATEADRDGFTELSRSHEQEINRLTDRIEELEDQLAEASRREQVLESNQRALQENANNFDGAVAQFSKDRDEWLNERDEMLQQHHQELDGLVRERDDLASDRDDLAMQRDDLIKKCSQLADKCDGLLKERDTLLKERDGLTKEREGFVMERDARDLEHQTLMSRHETSSSLNRALHERIGASLGALLGRPAVAEQDMASAMDEVAAQMARRDRDIARLREEVEDITAANEGADADFMRVSSERDEWKQVAENAKQEAAAATDAHRSTQDEHMELVRKMRTQNTEISELKQRLELTGAGAAGSPTSSPELVIKVAKLETELARINTALAKAWSVLPAPAASGDAGLNDPRIVSPNSYINFAALQSAYSGPPASDKYPGIDELLERVQSVVGDGRILVERMSNLEKDKERHKANASKAAMLVENSQQALETYKRQVDRLEEQLDANQLALESYQHQVAELHDQMAYKSASVTEQSGDLERALAGLRDAQERNVQLSSDLAAKTAALTQVETEVETLRSQASRMEKENEDERRRFQEQHMVILDEMNQAQEQNDALRTKLRAANASTTSVNRTK